jgi:hypothetical protein
VRHRPATEEEKAVFTTKDTKSTKFKNIDVRILRVRRIAIVERFRGLLKVFLAPVTFQDGDLLAPSRQDAKFGIFGFVITTEGRNLS